MNIFWGELIGTFILVLLGNGVVANVLLKHSKGENSGWIVISTGWGAAVAVAVYLVGWLSGAHINPAVTFSFALSGATAWSLVPTYLAGQMLGGFLGAIFVFLTYYPHFQATKDAQLKFLCFSTKPAIYNPKWNAATEVIATAVLILGIFGILNANNELSSGLGPYLIGMLVTSIGLSLGGPTGYAINPARDIAPRIAFTLLHGPKDANWKYAWVPGLAPFLGAYLGQMLSRLLY